MTSVVSAIAVLAFLGSAQGTETEWEQLPEGVGFAGRYGHTASMDAAGSSMLVFGGMGDDNSYLEDLWRFDVASSSWEQLSPSGSQPGARFGHSATMNAAGSLMLVFGGWNGSSHDFADLWQFDIASSSWEELSPSGSKPGARRLHSAAMDAAGGMMLIYGGVAGSGVGTSYWADLWRFDVASSSWEQLSPSGSQPGSRHGHSATMDAAGGMMLIYGGNFGRWPMGELWQFDVTNSSWEQLNPTGSRPGGRGGHSATMDAAGSFMVVFGGIGTSGYASFAYLGDLWRFDIANSSWQELTPAGSQPGTRVHHTATMDAAGSVMLLCGGDRSSVGSELWRLTITTITTSTTITTITSCEDGTELQDSQCTACPAGKHSNISTGLACTDCGQGQWSAPGAATCLPTVESALQGLATPEVVVQETAGIIRITISLDWLTMETYEGLLSYRVDIAQLQDALFVNSACGDLWREEGQHSFVLHTSLYDFTGSCPMELESQADASNISHAGVLGIALHLNDGTDDGIVLEWVQPLRITRSTSTAAFFNGSFFAADPLILEAREYTVAGFYSELKLFHDESFEQEVSLPYFEAGDPVFVMQKLSDLDLIGPNWNLEVERVYLSTSKDASSAPLHDLTEMLLQSTQIEGGVTFAFAAPPCSSCFLHSVAKVIANGRRLAPRRYHTLASLRLEIRQRSNVAEEEEEVTLVLEPKLAVGVAFLCAVIFTGFLGAMMHKFGDTFEHKDNPELSLYGFFILEVIDVLLDWFSFALTAGEGDLTFANDPNTIMIAVASSCGLSTVLFMAELFSMVRFKAFRSTWKFQALVLLHLGCEDAFQTVIYSMVAWSQASSGVGAKSAGTFSIIQAILMLGLKVLEMSGVMQALYKRFAKKAKEGYAAGDTVEPATIGVHIR